MDLYKVEHHNKVLILLVLIDLIICVMCTYIYYNYYKYIHILSICIYHTYIRAYTWEMSDHYGKDYFITIGTHATY